MTNGDAVSYTVKELLQMLERTLTGQIDTVAHKLDMIDAKLEEKAERSRVHELENRVTALDLVTLKRAGPVDEMVKKNTERLTAIELRLAGSAALSIFQRWLIGTVGVGVLGTIVALIALIAGGR